MQENSPVGRNKTQKQKALELLRHEIFLNSISLLFYFIFLVIVNQVHVTEYDLFQCSFLNITLFTYLDFCDFVDVGTNDQENVFSLLKVHVCF